MKLVVLALAGGMLVTNPIKIHSWYDADCCSDRDCFPVEAKHLDNGNIQFKTQQGFLELNLRQHHDKIRPSKDENYHICMIPNEGAPKILCIYVPSGA